MTKVKMLGTEGGTFAPYIKGWIGEIIGERRGYTVIRFDRSNVITPNHDYPGFGGECPDFEDYVGVHPDYVYHENGFIYRDIDFVSLDSHDQEVQ